MCKCTCSCIIRPYCSRKLRVTLNTAAWGLGKRSRVFFSLNQTVRLSTVFEAQAKRRSHKHLTLRQQTSSTLPYKSLSSPIPPPPPPSVPLFHTILGSPDPLFITSPESTTAVHIFSPLVIPTIIDRALSSAPSCLHLAHLLLLPSSIFFHIPRARFSCPSAQRLPTPSHETVQRSARHPPSGHSRLFPVPRRAPVHPQSLKRAWNTSTPLPFRCPCSVRVSAARGRRCIARPLIGYQL